MLYLPVVYLHLHYVHWPHKNQPFMWVNKNLSHGILWLWNAVYFFCISKSAADYSFANHALHPSILSPFTTSESYAYRTVNTGCGLGQGFHEKIPRKRIKKHDFLLCIIASSLWCIKIWITVYLELGGGNSNIFYFHPDPWGSWTHFDEHILQVGGSTTN